jgi:hypothetical protein
VAEQSNSRQALFDEPIGQRGRQDLRFLRIRPVKCRRQRRPGVVEVEV